MTYVALFVFVVLAGTAGLLGHPHVLARAAGRALTRASRRRARDRHLNRLQPVASWTRNEGER
ncbi:hypothetical protein QFZ66_005837 [Streptomyces sp. B4I13]|uniref:hypothetical protein n=1 Tax=Streptomyces sp. B4I13 TaxID=3042271 RepID=UPI00278AE53B|nr:hypothetical protein [Streptomyces sp. B4I13]MDQ0961959.1 hypothetical protein [Streptomyces sp. B4I13]